MNERGGYDYRLNRALKFLREESGAYRNRRVLLDAAMRKMLIEDWRADNAGFAQIKVGGRWVGTLIYLD